jgi:hypothetical protein
MINLKTATAVSPGVPMTLLCADEVMQLLLQCMRPFMHLQDTGRDPAAFPSSLEKYLGEVRLQRFGIGRLTTEADIAVGTDHIQTCTPSSIAVV